MISNLDDLKFEGGHPTVETTQKLYDQLDLQRAAQAYLDGGQNYRLRLPTGIPAKNFWSVTVYDTETRSLLQNGQPKPSISSAFDQPEVNPDGSVDIYFGPAAPEGREKNWIRTVPGQGHFVWIRLYGPLEPFFEQTWRPDDVVKV